MASDFVAAAALSAVLAAVVVAASGATAAAASESGFFAAVSPLLLNRRLKKESSAQGTAVTVEVTARREAICGALMRLCEAAAPLVKLELLLELEASDAAKRAALEVDTVVPGTAEVTLRASRVASLVRESIGREKGSD